MAAFLKSTKSKAKRRKSSSSSSFSCFSDSNLVSKVPLVNAYVPLLKLDVAVSELHVLFICPLSLLHQHVRLFALFFADLELVLEFVFG